jgi:hypothetical protein
MWWFLYSLMVCFPATSAALQLRLAGNMLAMGGDLDDAIDKYKQVGQQSVPRQQDMLGSCSSCWAEIRS